MCCLGSEVMWGRDEEQKGYQERGCTWSASTGSENALKACACLEKSHNLYCHLLRGCLAGWWKKVESKKDV